MSKTPITVINLEDATTKEKVIFSVRSTKTKYIRSTTGNGQENAEAYLKALESFFSSA